MITFYFLYLSERSRGKFDAKRQREVGYYIYTINIILLTKDII